MNVSACTDLGNLTPWYISQEMVVPIRIANASEMCHTIFLVGAQVPGHVRIGFPANWAHLAFVAWALQIGSQTSCSAGSNARFS